MKLIVINGPSQTGKTTLINDLLTYTNFEYIQTPDIATRGEVDVFETMLNHLDESKIYIIEDLYLQNLVQYRYKEEFNIEHNDFEISSGMDEDDYINDIMRLIRNHEVLLLTLTRDKINDLFEDDYIFQPKDHFNRIIELFFEATKEFGGYNQKILTHGEYNDVVCCDHLNSKHRIFEIIKSYFQPDFWETI